MPVDLYLLSCFYLLYIFGVAFATIVDIGKPARRKQVPYTRLAVQSLTDCVGVKECDEALLALAEKVIGLALT